MSLVLNNPIKSPETVADNLLNVPAWTNFVPSVEAFYAAGIKIHGAVGLQSLSERVQVEAPTAGRVRGEGVCGFIEDAKGAVIAEYLTYPQWGGRPSATITLKTAA